MGHQKFHLSVLISKMHCTYDLSKKCAQKSFSQKTILPTGKFAKVPKNWFFGQTF
jgi:hypothetical protein